MALAITLDLPEEVVRGLLAEGACLDRLLQPGATASTGSYDLAALDGLRYTAGVDVPATMSPGPAFTIHVGP